MKILIVGGNSFIGRNIYEQLCDKYDITCLTRQELDLLDCNKVRDYIKCNWFDVIIHTATYDAAPKHSLKDPQRVLENNLRMFFNVANLNNSFGKLLYFGSGAEFNRSYWTSNMTEEYLGKHIPEDQYGFSKYITSKYTENSDNLYNLRIFSVFGKYEDPLVRFISNAILSSINNETIVINGNHSYDFLYIDDLVKIVDWFINNKPKHHIYNICTNNPHNLVDIAQKIKKITGKNTRINVGKEKKISYSGNNSLYLQEIPFVFEDIDVSLEKLYNWYNENKNMIKL